MSMRAAHARIPVPGRHRLLSARHVHHDVRQPDALQLQPARLLRCGWHCGRGTWPDDAPLAGALRLLAGCLLRSGPRHGCYGLRLLGWLSLGARPHSTHPAPTPTHSARSAPQVPLQLDLLIAPGCTLHRFPPWTAAQFSRPAHSSTAQRCAF